MSTVPGSSPIPTPPSMSPLLAAFLSDQAATPVDLTELRQDLSRFVASHTALAQEHRTLRDHFLRTYGDGLTLQAWAIQRPLLEQRAEQAEADVATLRTQLATFHQAQIDAIRDAAAAGHISVAPHTIVHYLAPEITALLPELGVDDALVTDLSHVHDFEHTTLPPKFLWQLAIDRLRDPHAHSSHPEVPHV